MVEWKNLTNGTKTSEIVKKLLEDVRRAEKNKWINIYEGSSSYLGKHHENDCTVSKIFGNLHLWLSHS